MRVLPILLRRHWADFVRAEVRAGRYARPAEVVTRGLHALERREKRLGLLRQDLAPGLAEAARGEFAAPTDADAIVDALLARKGG